MKITEKTVNTIVMVALILSIVIGIRSFRPEKYNSKFADLKVKISNLVLDFQSTIESSLIPTTSPLPNATPTPKPYVYHVPTQDQKNYVLALGGILSRYNNENMTSLKSNLNVAGLRPMMKDSWNTFDHRSALETLDWLKLEGHRSEFDNVYEVLVLGNITTCNVLEDIDPKLCRDDDIKDIHDIASLVHKEVGDKSLIAWDFGRIINVARFAYSLGYISEEEAWTYMVPAAMTIQKTYGSWEEFGTHYILGRAYWMRDMNANKTQESILKYLINPVNKSPWTSLDWNTDLN